MQSDKPFLYWLEYLTMQKAEQNWQTLSASKDLYRNNFKYWDR